MSAVESTMLPLGTPLPEFCLPDTDGTTVSSADFQFCKALVVAFISNHCPFVKLLKSELARLAYDYQRQGVFFVAICSNDAVAYPDDSPTKMAEDKRAFGYSFPYLYDESQEVAKAFKAACTPDFHLFDRSMKLVYRGQFDSARPSNGITPTGRDLRVALDATLSGQPITAPQKPSIGCNIKWKPGNQPTHS